MATARVLEECGKILAAHLAHQDEKCLMDAADLGRKAFYQGVPPEGMSEILENALLRVAARQPDIKLADAASSISAMMTEMLMAYGLGYRHVLAEKEALLSELGKLSLAVEQNPCMVIITDPDGVIEYVNPKFTEISGYASAEAIGGIPNFLTPGTTPPEIHDQLWQTLRDGRRWCGEFLDEHKDGSAFWVSASINPIRNEDGEITHFLSIQENITGLKMAEDQLRQMQKMEAVGQLTGGVAHDFNNILAGLQGNLDLISDLDLSAADRAVRLERCKSIVERGADLTRHLLAFSRKRVLAPTSVEVGGLVATMLKLMRRTLGVTITISTNFASDMWPAEVDPHQLENAVLNLAINARDAMPDGGDLSLHGHNIEIEEGGRDTHPGLAAGEYVAIAIHDTGKGIPAAQIDNVFDPFFTTKDVGKGSGLGLSMVHGFAKQSGGGVQIESQEGVGTRVTLYLPRARSMEAVRAAPTRLPRPIHGHGERIMVIEDDQEVRNVTTIALRHLGYDIIDGGDGSDAIKIALDQRDGIDLLLTDVVLPGDKNGSDLAVNISRKWRRMNVLLMTGYDASELPRVAREDLKYPLMQKPFGIADLANKVRELLEDRRPNEAVPG